MIRAWNAWMLASAIALGLAGCYPDAGDAEQPELHGLVLPLGELGVHLRQPALQNWLGWLEDGSAFAPFDMGQPGNDFALGLRLHSQVLPDESLFFSGKTVELVTDPEEALAIDLTIGDCPRCYFEAVVFWRDPDVDPQRVEVFAGDNAADPFDVPSASGQTGWTIDVWEIGQGQVDILAGSSAPQAGARVAARDTAENVRLPAVPIIAGALPLASLEQLPTGRSLDIEYDPIGDDRFFSTLETVVLQAGSAVTQVHLP